MHEGGSTYFPGLEFYRKSGSITGVVNNESGAQGVYIHLSDEEALAWLEAWLKGEQWNRTLVSQPES